MVISPVISSPVTNEFFMIFGIDEKCNNSIVFFSVSDIYFHSHFKWHCQSTTIILSFPLLDDRKIVGMQSIPTSQDLVTMMSLNFNTNPLKSAEAMSNATEESLNDAQ